MSRVIWLVILFFVQGSGEPPRAAVPLMAAGSALNTAVTANQLSQTTQLISEPTASSTPVNDVARPSLFYPLPSIGSAETSFHPFVAAAPGQSATDSPTTHVVTASPTPALSLALSTEPGPSSLSYNAPFYTCVRNFYVATTGRDSNAGTQTSPWLTIQHADSSSRLPGDCINVESGTYQASIVVRHGGTAPTSTGYIAYRCSSLDGCHVLAPANSNHLWLIESPANFVVVDGFEIDGNGTIPGKPDGVADQCIGSSWDDNRYDMTPNNDSSHHIWVLNNIVHHCNLSGISFSNKEWIYVVHNKVYHNSWTSGYEGSGIGLVVSQCIESGNPSCASGTTAGPNTGSYAPSGMDLTYAPPFHNIVSYNDVSDNSEAHNGIHCGSHTDGNGIILDTFFDEQTHTITYPYQTLVVGNVSYGNGGRGIHVFATSNVTVANNTAYGNGLNTCINAYYLGDLSQAGGANNIWVNNVAQSILTDSDPACGSYCGGRNTPFIGGNGRGVTDKNNLYMNNVLYGGRGVQMFDNDANSFSCAYNKCDTDPQFVDPGSGNFALKSTSPAVGYALSKPFLPPQLLSAGACVSTVATCP
jgi:parallel beta-helix repeat protein